MEIDRYSWVPELYRKCFGVLALREHDSNISTVFNVLGPESLEEVTNASAQIKTSKRNPLESKGLQTVSKRGTCSKRSID